jgi:hypothetical protein
VAAFAALALALAAAPGTASAYLGADNFADAQPLPEAPHQADGSSNGWDDYYAENTYATKEAGEPNHAGAAGGHSIWWTWTAPFSGTVSLTSCSSFATVIAAYTGSSVDALTLVGDGATTPGDACTYSTLGTARFQVVGGTTYRIAADGQGPATGTVRLSLFLTPPDTEAPKTRILDIKVQSPRRRATVSFDGKDNRNADDMSFECRLDGGRYQSCSTPAEVFKLPKPLQQTYRHLKVGRHVVRIRAMDGAGNLEQTPARRSFRIKPHP